MADFLSDFLSRRKQQFEQEQTNKARGSVIEPMPSNIMTRMRDRMAELFANTLSSPDTQSNQDYYNGFRTVVDTISPTDLETGRQTRAGVGVLGRPMNFIEGGEAVLPTASKAATRPTMWPDKFAPTLQRETMGIGNRAIDHARAMAQYPLDPNPLQVNQQAVMDAFNSPDRDSFQRVLDMMLNRQRSLKAIDKINKTRYRPTP